MDALNKIGITHKEDSVPKEAKILRDLLVDRTREAKPSADAKVADMIKDFGLENDDADLCSKIINQSQETDETQLRKNIKAFIYFGFFDKN